LGQAESGGSQQDKQKAEQSLQFPYTPPEYKNLVLEFLLFQGEQIQGHYLPGRIAKPAHRGGPWYSQLCGQGEISGSANQLFESVVIRTLVSDADTHAPIMASRARSSSDGNSSPKVRNADADSSIL
jgi:hypothetical protein